MSCLKALQNPGKKTMLWQNKQAARTGGGECASRGRCYSSVTDGCKQRRRKVTQWSGEESEGRKGGEVMHPFEDRWEAGWVAVVRPREGWRSREKRVLGNSMRDETAGTG